MVLWDSCPYSMGQLPIQYDCFLFQLPVQCWCYYLDCTNVTKSNKAHDSDQNTHWYTRNWSEIHKKDQEKLEWPWYAVGYALNYVKWCKMSVNLQVRSLMPWFQLHTENIWINFVKFYLKKQKLYVIISLSGYQCICPRMCDFKHLPFSLRSHASYS